MRLNANKVINARHSKPWKQEEAAAACGVSIVTYNKAENNGELHPVNAKKICDGLGLICADTFVPVGVDEPAELQPARLQA